MSIGNIKLQETETIIHQSESANDVILSITFYNSSDAEATFILFAYPAGSGPAVEANNGMVTKTLEPHSSFIWEGSEKFIIGLNDIVSAKASIANVIVATKIVVR